jgi:hypothetical protein
MFERYSTSNVRSIGHVSIVFSTIIVVHVRHNSCSSIRWISLSIERWFLATTNNRFQTNVSPVDDDALEFINRNVRLVNSTEQTVFVVCSTIIRSDNWTHNNNNNKLLSLIIIPCSERSSILQCHLHCTNNNEQSRATLLSRWSTTISSYKTIVESTSFSIRKFYRVWHWFDMYMFQCVHFRVFHWDSLFLSTDIRSTRCLWQQEVLTCSLFIDHYRTYLICST